MAIRAAERPAEPTIVCPRCKTEIRLDESLAAPLIEATRQEYESKLLEKDTQLADREASVRKQQGELIKAKEEFEGEVQNRVNAQRSQILADAEKKAQLVLKSELEARSNELRDLQEVLAARDEKLAEAQKAQAELLRKQRELDDAKRELELTVEKRVQESIESTRVQARKDAEDAIGLKLKEKELAIASMQKQIEELKRKAEQGSQQLQGETQEVELEQVLGSRFPTDAILPVPKGEHGGDVIHRVLGPSGQICGCILWESKRTKNWSDNWLSKLRNDQRIAKADIAVIVSEALPDGIESFGLVDGIWVGSLKVAVPLAIALRHTIIEVAQTRQSIAGQDTKMELVYDYLIGPRFRHRIQAIAEAFSTMQDDLLKERKLMLKQWAKREEQLTRVMESTVGMYGDFQGIAGKTLQEIDGLKLPELHD